MAGRYRALLIGNSTYPADEHNLQTLKGPVKDIAVLNRALVDRNSGLFADVDVTLLPEATSSRAIRALGRFFGTADRDDVLLVYFSGHGKLDQGGRLHLCMQDTDSADLLSTAVSSARINEFADASHARNVVIVLDCCYAGAFRGAALGDAVAGPGRYVLTSCRGTQLANDATVENGTSFFTQHLVEGLVQAADDRDGDGYVTFSDLYAYVDRRLREAGKQIPQRRVDGDGDLRLARRPQQAPAEVGAADGPPPVLEVSPSRLDLGEIPPGRSVGGPPPGAAASGADAAVMTTVPAAGGPRPQARRRVLLVVAAAIAAVAGGTIAALALLPVGSGGSPHAGGSSPTSGILFTTRAPWRLRITDDGYGSGCSITLIDAHSGAQTHLADGLYATSTFQIQQTGSFRWRVNNPACKVVPLPGSGTQKLPFTWDQSDAGDTDAFPAPPKVAVTVRNYHGDSSCEFTLHNQADGQPLDDQTATPGADTVTLNPQGHKMVYLSTVGCKAHVSAAH